MFLLCISPHVLPVPCCEEQLEPKQKAAVLLACAVRGEKQGLPKWKVLGHIMEKWMPLGRETKVCLSTSPKSFWLITELHLCCVARPQGAQQKARVEFESSQVNWLLGQNLSCFGRREQNLSSKMYSIKLKITSHVEKLESVTHNPGKKESIETNPKMTASKN